MRFIAVTGCNSLDCKYFEVTDVVLESGDAGYEYWCARFGVNLVEERELSFPPECGLPESDEL